MSTGWYSEFGRLADKGSGQTGYGDKAFRFWGSTFDASGLYRFNAVMKWLHDLHVTPREIHAHVATLETRFLNALAEERFPGLDPATLIPAPDLPRGNFCTFDLPEAAAIETRLAEAHIRVDRRGTRLRFGFGLYQDEAYVDRLIERMREALK